MFKLSYLYRSLLLIFFIYTAINAVHSQEKKVMDESVYSIWNSISDTKISNNGEWILYTQSPDQGDKTLKIYNTRTRSSKSFPRVDKPSFSDDNSHVYFLMKPGKEKIKALKRKKTKKEEMPNDSLAIYNFRTKQIDIIPNVKNYKSPQKWSGVIAYQLGEEKIEQDSTKQKRPKAKPKKKAKKGEEAQKLVINNISLNRKDTIESVVDYVFSEEGDKLLLSRAVFDSTELAGVYLYDKSNATIKPIFKSTGKYQNLSIDKIGEQVAFLADLDTTDTKHRPLELYHWSSIGLNKIADRSAEIVGDGWDISADQKLLFSEDGKRLFFGKKPQEVLQDTTLLDEEIVSVEVWSYKDGKLYTQQAAQADRTKKESYLHVYHIDKQTIFKLGSMNIPNVRLNNEGTSKYAIGLNDRPYHQNISWAGFAQDDIYRINVNTGEYKTIGKKMHLQARVSPLGNYFYWYSYPDSAWYTYQVESEQITNLTQDISAKFSNELHDSPSLPRSYGSAGWTQNEDRILIYDRYDLWSIDPKGNSNAERLTNGRANKTSYRNIVLDPEQKFIDTDQLLLRAFNENDKSSSLVKYDIDKKEFETLLEGPFLFRNIKKAKDSDDILFSKESFNIFPDLLHTQIDFKNVNRVSIANPQQKDYSWGNSEVVSWTNLNGKQVEGLLFKPEGFDPKKKYPLLVNFYEKSSSGLHRHRAPYAHRSTINYTMYLNNGYMIFNPDIHYEDGYPGKSCYDNVMPGVEMLIEKGNVDKDRIGIQGHSWGGYQIAHLLTKTDMFKCAEAGAPVVNMVSAYGGIRWQTGLSRMFQYEKTQSRLGATLWEKPDLYLENSPIFNLDKMNTPVLIMHNDADGHVPWYQGIEYFVALRRLGKPSWMLNYNGEPHWPLKWQNRLDFNIRMKQFFDHYLKDAPAPRWMRESIPAIEKGINLGYELEDASRN